MDIKKAIENVNFVLDSTLDPAVKNHITKLLNIIDVLVIENKKLHAENQQLQNENERLKGRQGQMLSSANLIKVRSEIP